MPEKVQAVETVGVSPKAQLAFYLPALATLVMVALDGVLSPGIDPTLKIALVGAIDAVLALVGAWAGKPGTVLAEPLTEDIPTPVVPPGLENDLKD